MIASVVPTLDIASLSISPVDLSILAIDVCVVITILVRTCPCSAVRSVLVVSLSVGIAATR